MAETAASAPPRKNLIARVTAWALALKPVRAFLLYGERHGPMLADSVTYRTLFSVFAGVLLGFSIAAIWLAGNPVAWQALLDAVNAAIPGLIGEEGVIDSDAIQAPAGLTIAGIIALVGLVGAAIGAIGSLRIAFRTLTGQLTDDVLFIWVLLRNLALGLGIGAAFVASAGVTILGTAGIGWVGEWLGLAPSDPLMQVGTRGVTIIVVFVLDAVAIAVLFRVLAGVRPSARALWSGALLGAVGLTVLQQLSGLFIGGASANPLLATFASLIALLIWLNLSAQVVLISGAYIVTGMEEEVDRVRARHGAPTFARRRVQRAEESVRVASDELFRARELEEKERVKASGGDRESEAQEAR